MSCVVKMNVLWQARGDVMQQEDNVAVKESSTVCPYYWIEQPPSVPPASVLLQWPPSPTASLKHVYTNLS